MSMEDFLKLGTHDREPGTVLGMDSCACFTLFFLPSLSHLLIHPGWPRPWFPDTGPIFLSHGQWGLWSLSRCLVLLKALHWVLGERLPFPFTVLTASTSISSAPISPIELPALSLHWNTHIKATKDVCDGNLIDPDTVFFIQGLISHLQTTHQLLPEYYTESSGAQLQASDSKFAHCLSMYRWHTVYRPNSLKMANTSSEDNVLWELKWQSLRFNRFNVMTSWQ